MTPFEADIGYIPRSAVDILSVESNYSAHFAVDDQVLLYTSKLDLRHVGTDGKRKLSTRFIGPYPVVSKTSPDTNRLALPPGLKLHD